MRKFNEVPTAPEIKEGEKKPETKVIMEFMRHEEKAKAPDELAAQRYKNDQDVPNRGVADDYSELTPKGREKALARGKEEPGHPEVGIAFGSPRVRSAQTALYRMEASKNDQLTPEMTYAEAKELVDGKLHEGSKYKNRSKVRRLEELDFNAVKGEFNDAFLDAFKAGKTLDFLLKESDNKVKELKDKESLSYSRIAANIASLIGREMSVGNAFNRVVKKDEDKYSEYGNQLERYFGNHQSVSECFYMKVLEKIHGREKVVEFLQALREKNGDTKGFDFQEGFKVEITNNSEGQKVILQGIYGFDDMELTPELLREIIQDAVKLDREIENPKE